MLTHLSPYSLPTIGCRAGNKKPKIIKKTTTKHAKTENTFNSWIGMVVTVGDLATSPLLQAGTVTAAILGLRPNGSRTRHGARTAIRVAD